MPFYLLYIILLFLISFLYSKGWTAQILKLNRQSSWLITGISLFMLYLSVEQGQLLYEVVKNGSIFSMWIYWSYMIGSFVVPLVFAPLWYKLQLLSDNDFIRLRFSGRGAKVLELFRAYYVGMLIVTLLLSFHILAFSKFLPAFFNLSKEESLLVSGICLLVFALKNSFSLKLKTDLLHSIFYFAALLVLGYYIIYEGDGIIASLQNLKENRPEILQVWPNTNAEWFYGLAFISVQWWSVQMMDGGGPEMIRYRSANSEKGATLTGISSMLLSMLSGFVMIILILMLIAGSGNESLDFNVAIQRVIPVELQALIVIGWFGLFISTAESLMLWGIGFWSGDLYQRLSKKEKKEAPSLFLLVSMVFLSSMAIVAAYFAENLQTILQWFFSLSAGVAPIFILRWFWMRINAWTQLTAMASVPFLNLLYNLFDFSKTLPYHETEMGAYVWRLVILTVLTLVISFTVMILTPKDDSEHLSRFKEKRGPIASFRKAMILAILMGLLYFILWNYFWSWLLG